MAKGKQATKAKAPALTAAQSREEAEELLGDIGRAQRDIARIEARMNDKLAAIKEEYETEAAPLNEAVEHAFARLHLWAEANRAVLLKDGGKTAKLSTGELAWRFPPPKCSVQQEPVVVEALKQLGLAHLVRTKEEVNREAVLADPAAVASVPGIRISQDEQFIAKPFESEIERAVTQKRRAS